MNVSVKNSLLAGHREKQQQILFVSSCNDLVQVKPSGTILKYQSNKDKDEKNESIENFEKLIYLVF